MAYAGGITGGVAAAAVAAREAKKALIGGLLVEVDETTFQKLASENRERICVRGRKGAFKKRNIYAFSIDGLVIMTKTESEIPIPNEVIMSKRISIPSV